MAIERLRRLYKTFSIIFTIVLTGLAVGWVLTGKTGFLSNFSITWWVVLCFMGIEHIVKWALGG